MYLDKTRNTRRGLTLLELVIVIAILAVLAGAIVSQFDGIVQRSEVSVAATTINDVTRHIETYRALHNGYADGHDSLVDTTGTLYSKLPAQLLAPATLLAAPAPLDPTQELALKAAGINHVYLHDETVPVPSDSGTTEQHLVAHDGTSNGQAVVTIDTGSTAAPTDGRSLLANTFGIGATNDTTADINKYSFVVLGVGPHSWLVNQVMTSAPVFGVVDPGRFYARALAIYAVAKPGVTVSPAVKFLGTIGPDGSTTASNLASYYSQQATSRDH